MSRIAILGSGGREHAIGWGLSRSRAVESLHFLPGNGGTASIGTNHSVDILDFDAIADLLRTHGIDMVVGGSEAPLVSGIKDYIANQKNLKHVYVVGPDKAGARLEGSKLFAKTFMQQYRIPTAQARAFDENEYDDAIKYVSQKALPHVIKADGLAAGKGVFISHTLNESKQMIHQLMKKKCFGDASIPVLIEDHLKGMELSCFLLSDGTSYVYLPEVKDYKRRYAGDKGPNTGGMGAVSPVPFVDHALRDRIQKSIIEPTLAGLKAEQIPYSGFLFIGLMLVEHMPYVLEYNVRLGDPEAQALLPRVRSDLGELLQAMRLQRLNEYKLDIDTQATAVLTIASKGYPSAYKKGIRLPNLAAVHADQYCFHAGTEKKDNHYITSGGRVLSLVSRHVSLREAIARNYAWCQRLAWQNGVYREDIGADLKLSPAIDSVKNSIQ